MRYQAGTVGAMIRYLRYEYQYRAAVPVGALATATSLYQLGRPLRKGKAHVAPLEKG